MANSRDLAAHLGFIAVFQTSAILRFWLQPHQTRSRAEAQWSDCLADEPFVIVSRAEEDYIQMYRHDDGDHQLEYREDGPESHFVTHTTDARLVADVMWAWVIGDERWRDMVEWTFLDVDALEESRELADWSEL